MAEVTLFVNSTFGPVVLDVDEALVSRDVADRLSTTAIGNRIGGPNYCRSIGELVAQLLVERASDWIAGYVFTDETATRAVRDTNQGRVAVEFDARGNQAYRHQ